MQAVVFILEGDHVVEIKEQVRLNTCLHHVMLSCVNVFMVYFTLLMPHLIDPLYTDKCGRWRRSQGIYNGE